MILRNLVKQTDFPDDTGLPRWGCFWRSIVAIAEMYLSKRLSQGDLMELYRRCREATNWQGKPVLSIENQETYELHCNSPRQVLQMALDFFEGDMYIAEQTGGWDSHNGGPQGWYSWSDVQEWVGMAKYWKRPSGGHYTLYMPMHDVAWDPHGGLKLEPHIDYRLFWIGGKS